MNFKIINGNNDWLKQVDNFVELYNDITINSKTIISKLKLTVNEYRQLRKHCINEGLITPRKSPHPQKSKQKQEPTHIYYNGYSFIVKKRVAGEYVYGGSYRKHSDAVKVRDALKKCNWDKNQIKQIKQEVLNHD